MQNLPYENEFDLHLNELVGKIDFRTKGFALVLVLKQRQMELGNGLLSLIPKLLRYQPRPVFSEFKMAARRRPWQTADHVSPKILKILFVSKWLRALLLANLWTRDLLFARVFSEPPF